jgi:2-phospho-L-lactate guanylyltransferase
MDLWAVVPVKERASAKERLAPMLRPETRQTLALAMLEDVLAALTATRGIAGLLVVTVDPEASRLAASYGGRVTELGARDGHTGAVTAAARLLAAEGCTGMLTLPGDIPLVTPAEIESVLAAHLPAPSFTIVPSHDERGSNAIACSPPDAVPLRFGENSFYPHLQAAETCGIRPNVLRLPGIALDIDNPEDVVSFMRTQSPTRAWAVLSEERMPLVGGFRR